MVAKSIQLISQDKNSNLVLNPEGLEQLKAIKQELGVCVVVGYFDFFFNFSKVYYFKFNEVFNFKIDLIDKENHIFFLN
jgi:hypothetical protein